MMASNNMAWQYFTNFATISFIVFGVISFAVGLGLIVSSAGTFQMFRALNQWVSTRAVLKSVEIPRETDQVAHRYRRWLGGAFILFGVVAIFGLIGMFDVGAVSVAIFKSLSRPFIAWIVQSLRWFLVIGSLLGLVVGAMLCFYPDALGAFERFANQWISSRQFLRHGDDMNLTLDRLVEAHPKPFGWVITVASAGVVVSALVLLGRH
ncbi:MAG TPA: hypothetical protein VF871_05980 [Burkholderiales bacterium]